MGAGFALSSENSAQKINVLLDLTRHMHQGTFGSARAVSLTACADINRHGVVDVMMAPASTPPPGHPQLSVESLDELRRALNSYTREDDLTAIHPALRRIAQEARDKRMHPEQLLVALKEVWFALPQIRRATPTDAQGRMLQRVVTLCIREYYST